MESARAPSSATFDCSSSPAKTHVAIHHSRTLGAGLGVSDRQARNYVKELERAGLITVDQRGLRKMNVYLFLWTPELDQLLGSVPERSTDPGNGESGPGDRGLAGTLLPLLTGRVVPVLTGSILPLWSGTPVSVP